MPKFIEWSLPKKITSAFVDNKEISVKGTKVVFSIKAKEVKIIYIDILKKISKNMKSWHIMINVVILGI